MTMIATIAAIVVIIALVVSSYLQSLLLFTRSYSLFTITVTIDMVFIAVVCLLAARLASAQEVCKTLPTTISATRLRGAPKSTLTSTTKKWERRSTVDWAALEWIMRVRAVPAGKRASQSERHVPAECIWLRCRGGNNGHQLKNRRQQFKGLTRWDEGRWGIGNKPQYSRAYTKDPLTHLPSSHLLSSLSHAVAVVRF